MSRRKVRRRTSAEWVVRGVLAVAALVLAYVAVTRSFAEVLVRTDPARAHDIAPGNGKIAGIYAQSIIGSDPGKADLAKAVVLGRRALQRDATVVPAVATLGVAADTQGQKQRARRLFDYSERLSRRDLGTQIWAIEDSIGKQDVAAALRHYDIALRTSRAAPGLLFPVLGGAIAEPQVRAGLVRIVSKPSEWTDQFIDYLATDAADLRTIAQFFIDLRQAGRSVSDVTSTKLVDRMVGGNLMDEAWRYYASYRPGVDRGRSRNPRFMRGGTSSSVFDWRVLDVPGTETSIQSGQGSGFVEFSASPSVGGAVLRQIQVLPAGVYRLSGHVSGIDQPQNSLPYWTLECSDGRELGRVTVPPSGQGGRSFIGQIIVPAGCPKQALTFVVRPSDAITGSTGRIDQAELTMLTRADN